MTSHGEPPSSAMLKVGDFWVHPALSELERDGVTIHLESRSMDVLLCLERWAPELVPKARILEEVWGDAYVGDEVVSHAIWELRRAFEDKARDPSYIQTLPRKGYRLVAPVCRDEAHAEPMVGSRFGKYGQYEIEAELGSGAMGIVFRARDRRLGRVVALKFLAPELTRDEVARRRFEREARLAAAADHPNLGTVHEIDEVAGRQFIVTAYYGGGTLKQRLSEGRMPTGEALRISLELARGLAEAHRRGIIHRDVKPANILLSEGGTAKLVDFGIAKLLNGTQLTQLTETGKSLGTPAYKSPEQSRGEPVDQRSDIWALGVVLYELVSGRRPFAGEYEHAVVRSILEDEPPPLREAAGRVTPGGFERVVHKALAKKPAERYQSGDEMVRDLEAVLAGAPVARPESLGSRSRRGLVAAALAAVLGIASILGLPMGLSRSLPSLAPISFWKWMLRDTAEGPISISVKASVQIDRYVEDARDEELECGTLGSRRAAEQDFLAALALAPENSRLEALLALTRMGLVTTSELGPEIELGVERAEGGNPSHWLAHLARAKLSLLRGQQAEAVEKAREALELAPVTDEDRDLAFIVLGQALIGRGDEAEGLSKIEEGVHFGRGDIRANLALAYALWNAGKLDSAASAYVEILEPERRPEHCAALSNLGALYLEMGRFTDAVPKLNLALERDPSPSTANNLGMAYLYQREIEKALAAFLKATALAPKFAHAHAGLGDVYDELFMAEGADEDAENARQSWQKAIELYSMDAVVPIQRAESRALRAVYLAKLGQVDEARKEMGKALGEGGSNSQLAFYEAQLHALVGDKEGVYDAVRRAMDGRSLALFEVDPCFREFQSDQEFQDILEGQRR